TKEAIFSWLESRDWLEDNAVLDLYSGSGGLAVEAASRGAATVVGVESARPPARIAEDNAKTVNQALNRRVVTISQMPVQRWLRRPARARWDLLIYEPPYDIGEDLLLAMIAQAFHMLLDEGLFILDRPYKAPRPAWPDDVYVVDARRYGEAMMYFVRRTGY